MEALEGESAGARCLGEELQFGEIGLKLNMCSLIFSVLFRCFMKILVTSPPSDSPLCLTDHFATAAMVSAPRIVPVPVEIGVAGAIG